MVSVISTLVVASTAVFVSIASPCNSLTYPQAEGEYFKPSDASGLVNTTVFWRRGPCPALNSLANFGYIERNGQNITKTSVDEAIKKHFSVADEVRAQLISRLPDTFALNLLSASGHDISLSRPPSYSGVDPAKVDKKLVENLVSRAKDGFLDAEAVWSTYKARITTYRSDSRFNVTEEQLNQGSREGSVLILILGGNRNDRISIEYARSFLIDEKFPNDWNSSYTPVSIAQVRTMFAQIRPNLVFP
ncbi:putative chloroperoxidase [Plasmopara halstedii]